MLAVISRSVPSRAIVRFCRIAIRPQQKPAVLSVALSADVVDDGNNVLSAIGWRDEIKRSKLHCLQILFPRAQEGRYNNQNFRVYCLGQAEDVIEISSRQPILAKY